MIKYSTHTDIELLALIKEDRTGAFAELYNRYKGPLYLHAYKMLQDDEEAKDVVQEVFTTLWLKKADVKPPVAAFLYAASRNKILNQIKHLKIEARYMEQCKAVLEYPSVILPDEHVIERDFAKLIEAGIQSLPPKMRRIFELSRKEFKTHQEISEELQISSLTVKRQVSNAISILKNKLQSFLFFF